MISKTSASRSHTSVEGAIGRPVNRVRRGEKSTHILLSSRVKSTQIITSLTPRPPPLGEQASVGLGVRVLVVQNRELIRVCRLS